MDRTHTDITVDRDRQVIESELAFDIGARHLFVVAVMVTDRIRLVIRRHADQNAGLAHALENVVLDSDPLVQRAVFAIKQIIRRRFGDR